MTPHRSFLVLGLGFGALFVLATPPFAPPDELRHFLRAYLVSEGRFAVPGQAPGYSASIPRSLARLEPSPIESAGRSYTVFWSRMNRTVYSPGGIGKNS